MAKEIPQSPIDGIGIPENAKAMEAEAETVREKADDESGLPPEMKKATSSLSFTLIAIVVLMIIYIAPTFIVASIFPTRDGSLSTIKSSLVAVYGFGAMIVLMVSVVGLVRIATFKDRPRTQIKAFMRLAGVAMPLLMASGIILYVVTKQPTLTLDIESPSTTDALVAPISITLSTKTAAKVFQQQNLVPIKYEWDFNGDGTIDQQTFESEGTFVYSKADIYTASVIVTMQNGEQRKLLRQFRIPKSSFSVNPDAPIIDETALFSIINLVEKKEDIKKAEWDFDGDGTIDTATSSPDTSFTYHRLGDVTAVVTITFANGTQSKFSRTVSIIQEPSPPFPITLETDPATLLSPPPFPITFTLKTSEPIANASWAFGDNKTGEGLVTQHIYKDVGSFTATVTVRSQSGTVAKLTKIIQVADTLALPDLTFDGSPTANGDTLTGEVPLSLDITPSTSQPLVSFSWDAPGATEVLSTHGTLRATYRKEGKYPLELIAFDPDNKALRKRMMVNVVPTSTSVIFSMDPQAPEAPATVRFDASDTYIRPGDEVTGFEWDFGDGMSNSNFSGSRIQHIYDKPGTYTITLNVRTIAGAIYTSRQTLVVRAPQIRACFLSSRNQGKAPLAVNFDSSCSTGEFTSWLWDFGDQSQSDVQNPPPHVFTSVGNFTVTLRATTKDGRVDSYKTIISVTSP